MRLLWMKSDYVLPADTGGKIRSYNLLRELRHLCEVTYLSFKPSQTPLATEEMQTCASEVVTVPREEEQKSGIRFYGRILRGMWSRLPYVIQKYRCGKIRKYQAKLLRKPPEDGVLLCDFLTMAENVDWSLPHPKVLFQHNVETQIWKRYYQTETNPLKKAYFYFEQLRMRRYEAAMCNRFDLVFTVSPEDRDLLRDEFGVRRPIEVLETGVDTEYFAPRETTPTGGKLLFLGSLDWMPNIDAIKWFVQDVYPSIRAEHPHVSLDIVGRRPTPELRRLAAEHAHINLIPDVPDVRPYIAAAELFLVPLRIGGGSRIKIYEAMAMRRPVVSTTIGAEGLPLTAEEHLAIGDTASAFANQVNQLLHSPEERSRLAGSGYQLVTEHHQWKHIAIKLRNHCQQLSRAT